MNINSNEHVLKTLDHCLTNQIALPEIFKYFDYQSSQLSVVRDEYFELEIKYLGLDNTNEFPEAKYGLVEYLTRMIELVFYQRDQIEQQRLSSFLQIIPKISGYFNLFIQNQRENHFQDHYQYINENTKDLHENYQLAKKAIGLLQAIQLLSENPTWQEIKKKYLIKILNYTVYIHQPLPQILGALHLVEQDLTLKVDKSLIKFLKKSGLYLNPKQYSHHLEEKELIYRLLDILSKEIINPSIQEQLEDQKSLHTLKVVRIAIIFKQISQIDLSSKKNQIYRIYHKIKVIYLDFISSREILAPELIKQIEIIKQKTNNDENFLKMRILVNPQLIQDLANNPFLKDLNNQCQISLILSKKTMLQDSFDVEEFLSQYITKLQPQQEEQQIFNILTIIHQNRSTMVKDLHLILQQGGVISLMSNLKNNLPSKMDQESIIFKVYGLLSQLNEFVNSHFQQEAKISEKPEFYDLNKQDSENQAMKIIFKKDMIQNRNIRKILDYMIQKQIIFPEFLNFLQIVIKVKMYLLQLNKCSGLVNLIENTSKIQQFMNMCINGEEALFHQIKLTDFDKLPVPKDAKINKTEQKALLRMLQILFEQKEIHRDSLIQIFQQGSIQCLIYEMKQIYTQYPNRTGQIQQAYQIMYVLNYWAKKCQSEENIAN